MTRNVHIYDSRPDLNFLLNRKVVLGGAKSIELETTMTGFLVYLIVDKLNYPKAVSQNFFNGKMQMKSKSFLMLKKKKKRKRNYGFQGTSQMLWFCVIE